MALTEKGLWYPDPSTPMNLHTITRQMQESVDTQLVEMVAGQVSITLNNATSGSATINYAALGATVAPAIQVTSGSSFYLATISGIPNSSTAIVAIRRYNDQATSTTITVHWTATRLG